MYALRDQNRRSGFSLVEMMVIVAIMGVIATAGTFAMGSWATAQRVKDATRSMADLILQGRGEAIRTGATHLVFFNTDASVANLVAPDGSQVAAMLINDVDGDGSIDPGEYVSSVPLDISNTLSWGVTSATVPVPTDPTVNHAAPPPSPWTFTQPGGAAANWVALFPDGTPRGFSIGPFAADPMGSGAGAVYLTNGERDYALVVASLGGVRVHGWNLDAGAWRQ
jgi:prepilin-type N-terminal cleavage/methylation domain-containing protein